MCPGARWQPRSTSRRRRTPVRRHDQLLATRCRGRPPNGRPLPLEDLDTGDTRTELPSILAGDFNAGPDASSIRYPARAAVPARPQRPLSRRLGRRPLQFGRARHTWTVDNPDAAEEIDRHRRSTRAPSPPRLRVHRILAWPTRRAAGRRDASLVFGPAHRRAAASDPLRSARRSRCHCGESVTVTSPGSR